MNKGTALLQAALIIVVGLMALLGVLRSNAVLSDAVKGGSLGFCAAHFSDDAVWLFQSIGDSEMAGGDGIRCHPEQDIMAGDYDIDTAGDGLKTVNVVTDVTAGQPLLAIATDTNGTEQNASLYWVESQRQILRGGLVGNAARPLLGVMTVLVVATFGVLTWRAWSLA